MVRQRAVQFILTLPNGENKEYHVKPDYKFMVEGKPATVPSCARA